jgi:PBP1b-binding outer membrane lipoprotein LpoB
MKLFFKVSIVALVLFLNGCVPPAPAAHSNYEKPDWIYNHTEGAVGICDTHMKGDAAQEQVAMDRALEKLSKQQGVEVQSESFSQQKETAAYYSSGHKSTATIKANNKVKAKIKKTWRDPRNNRYYVWMVME